MLSITAQQIPNGSTDATFGHAWSSGMLNTLGSFLCVLQMRGAEHLREFTAVGPLAGFRVGQDLALTGRWVTSPRFGQQFRAADGVSRPTASARPSR